METLRDLDIVRAAPTAVRAQDGQDAAMPTMVVRFSAFNSWYEIDSFWEGRFLERTAPGSFSKTIKESRSNIKCLFDHGYDTQIGNKVLGPIDDLREDSDSAVGEVPLFDTSYNRDLLPGLQAGVYGSSFRFRVIRDEWNDEPERSEYNPDGIPERTIKEVRLFEFGPVTFPANPESTTGLRSITDDFYARLKTRDPQRVSDLHNRNQAIRTPGSRPDSGAAVAPSDVPDSTEHHPSGLSMNARSRELAFPFLTLKR